LLERSSTEAEVRLRVTCAVLDGPKESDDGHDGIPFRRNPRSLPIPKLCKRSVLSDVVPNTRCFPSQHPTFDRSAPSNRSETKNGQDRRAVARERHGLFRCGAFAAAHVRRPSIQNIRERYSDRVPPGPNNGRLTSSRLVSSARTVVFY